MGAIVLAQNEAYAGTVYGWKDVTGEHYQFPNQYRTRIVPGTRFVYYRGARRADGSRATPEYFGVGVVGDVYLDADTAQLAAPLRRWNADIVEYVPFAQAVPFRDDAGVFMETGTNEVAKNHWGVGVRAITEDRLQAIVEAARTPEAIVTVEPLVPPIDAATPVIRTLTAAVTPLLISRREPVEVSESRRTFDTRRLSRRAREIGCAAEEVFYRHLLASEPDPARREQIVWVANLGETPGYDIEDRRQLPPLAYEVKGTTGSVFPSFDMTANELRAAEALRERYCLVLVSECLGERPTFDLLRDPAGLLLCGKLHKQPISFRIEARAIGEAPRRI